MNGFNDMIDIVCRSYQARNLGRVRVLRGESSDVIRDIASQAANRLGIDYLDLRLANQNDDGQLFDVDLLPYKGAGIIVISDEEECECSMARVALDTILRHSLGQSQISRDWIIIVATYNDSIFRGWLRRELELFFMPFEISKDADETRQEHVYEHVLSNEI